MSTYITTKIDIYGDPKHITVFKKECFDRNHKFDLNKIIPLNKLTYLLIRLNIVDPFKWCSKNWGPAKGNCFNYKLLDESNTIFGGIKLSFQFDTKNVMPVPILKKIINKYNNLRFDIFFYDEDGKPYTGFNISYFLQNRS